MKKKIKERLDELNNKINFLEEQQVNIIQKKHILTGEKEFLTSLLNNKK
jgi:hypothetical protein